MDRPPKFTGAKRLGQGRFTLAQQPMRRLFEEKSGSDWASTV
jgi:hypothetical protein